VTSGDLAVGPLQTPDEAKQLALMLKGADEFTYKARKALREFLGLHGRVDLGERYIAELGQGYETSLPLPKVLDVLDVRMVAGEIGRQAAALTAYRQDGQELEDWQTQCRALLQALAGDPCEDSPKFDVPLDKLVIGSISIRSYAKAKKRAGLGEQLDAAAIKKPTSDLKIRQLEEGEV
jgi:hypothetical protein